MPGKPSGRVCESESRRLAVRQHMSSASRPKPGRRGSLDMPRSAALRKLPRCAPHQHFAPGPQGKQSGQNQASWGQKVLSTQESLPNLAYLRESPRGSPGPVLITVGPPIFVLVGFKVSGPHPAANLRICEMRKRELSGRKCSARNAKVRTRETARCGGGPGAYETFGSTSA